MTRNSSQRAQTSSSASAHARRHTRVGSNALCQPSSRTSLSSALSQRTPRNDGFGRDERTSYNQSQSLDMLASPSTPSPSIRAGDSDGGDPDDAGNHNEPQEVIMAINLKNDGLLGCAYFTTANGTLSLLNHLPMTDTHAWESLIAHAQPTTMLVSARAPEPLMGFLEGGSTLEEADAAVGGFDLRVLPSAEFAYETACEKLINLDLHPSAAGQAAMSEGREDFISHGIDAHSYGDPHAESRHMKMIRFDALINLEDHLSVACAGAIINDLLRRRSAEFLPGESVSESLFQIRHIQTSCLTDFMLVNTDTLLSLQIVKSELHPNSQALGPASSACGQKESLSLYGLFHHLASTPQGRSRLRQIFLQPTLELDIILQRQQAISMLIRPENEERLLQASAILRRVNNMRSVVDQLRRGVDSPSCGRSFDRGIWITLRKFAAQALKLRECATTFSIQNVDVVLKLIKGIQPASLVAVGDMVNKTIDFEQSRSRQRSSVRAGVDLELNELKRRYDGMGSFLTLVVDQVNSKLPTWASQYIRSWNGLYDGEGADGGKWEKLFTADGAVCYKNTYMKELDELYGDMYCEIGDREVEVIHGLASAVISHGDALIEASDLCGEFDAILALATGAKKYEWVEPCVTAEPILEIEGGRHPLQELVVPAFVPNDCKLMGRSRGGSSAEQISSRNQALIVTGPNHSGKSIYLKQTAIIVYLAHIGSYVPAAHATIGLTDKILTRISTRESVARTESAFSIDLKQISRAVALSTSRSLVIVDEFGKGTNLDDGAGLLAALIGHFCGLNEAMPRMLIATHFHEILSDEWIRSLQSLSLYHMDVIVDWETTELDEQLTYLFKLVPGCCRSSFGSRCAALNGVPSAVTERAEAIAGLLSRNEDITSACAKLTVDEEQQLELAEVAARKFISEDLGGHNGQDRHQEATDATNLLAKILST
ncbi:MutS protein [Paramyrothecium foliicola]|nr:MutS protein [Paramyrothecium foliicola]